MNANDVKAVFPRPPDDPIALGGDAVLTSHRMANTAADGEPIAWACGFCGAADPTATCVGRKWSDDVDWMLAQVMS